MAISKIMTTLLFCSLLFLIWSSCSCTKSIEIQMTGLDFEKGNNGGDEYIECQLSDPASWLGSHKVNFKLMDTASGDEVCTCHNEGDINTLVCTPSSGEACEVGTGAAFKYMVPHTVTTNTAYRCTVTVNTAGGVAADAATDRQNIYVQFISVGYSGDIKNERMLKDSKITLQLYGDDAYPVVSPNEFCGSPSPNNTFTHNKHTLSDVGEDTTFVCTPKFKPSTIDTVEIELYVTVTIKENVIERCDAGSNMYWSGSACETCPGEIEVVDDFTSICKPCLPPKQYLDANKECMDCAQGQMTTEQNEDSCTPCPAGLYWTSDYICKPCPINHYTDTPGQIACTPCEESNYTPYKGATSCIECKGRLVGTTCIQAVCKEGEHWDDAAKACGQCPEGTTSVGGYNNTCYNIKCVCNNVTPTNKPKGEDSSKCFRQYLEAKSKGC